MTQIKQGQTHSTLVAAKRLVERSTKTTITSSIEHSRALLKEVNHKIHSNPELAYTEHKAHDTLVAALQILDDVEVTPHAFGLETAFLAEFGSGGRVIAFNAEYDALPGIGHACGHNLIATSALGAFVGAVAALKTSGKPGRVRLLGTPAEERGGGKIDLIKAGAYKDVDACLMLHPGSTNDYPKNLFGTSFDPTLATTDFEITFTGLPAHAALAPWKGINALDAVVQGYNSVSALRQQIQPDERVHGIISHGGDAVNIIPDHATVQYGVRAPTLSGTHLLRERVINCFRGAALATGCEMSLKQQMEYADMRPNRPIATAYAEVMANLGYDIECNFEAAAVPASTDQGNVSYECPSWQGGFGIVTEKDVYNHTRGFTKSAGTPDAFHRCVEACKGMAMVGFQVLVDDSFAKKIREDFESWGKED
ncbi:putative metal-dependent amidase aminoacylase carboxypeptidase [Phaeomoniella chlamydospora]|uniref:Peptidase M20 domain-containing protein 2 n=1 Tax=Phaeomoniella chlamydospora TaxID=158046 RepID=A0A0G2GTA8_PHACM|nr:putative metal-dependent amidase aminoacylase carboxypeptidase [Phaeomoniella chlamydospora]